MILSFRLKIRNRLLTGPITGNRWLSATNSFALPVSGDPNGPRAILASKIAPSCWGNKNLFGIVNLLI